MKVLHITSKLSGGAGIAALRLHNALRKYNTVQSSIISNVSPKPKEGIFFFNREVSDFSLIKYKKNPIDKFKRQIGGIWKSLEMFSSPYSSIDITRYPEYRDADIIHFHWPTRILDYPTFFKRNHKPIVWTLHDMNPFLGGLHYEIGRPVNNRLVDQAEEEIIEIKKKALSYARNLIIVCLSQWMLQKSSSSELLGRFPHMLTRNVLDQTTFDIINRQLARQLINIPIDKNIFLFLTENINNRRKGFDILSEVIKKFSDNKNVFFITVGKQFDFKNQDNIKHLGYINEEKYLSLIYNAADWVILPSIEDNLPNVMLESLACGTPVISFKVGGMKEIIKNEINGLLVESISSEELFIAIKHAIKIQSTLNRSLIRERFIEVFDDILITKQYKNIYLESLRLEKSL